jgi:3,4-dihydroxy 2-butanone 4-phosphate synthase/GTP cyclohydrolase II
MGTQFGSVEQAVAEIAAGRPVIVVDDEDREDEGDLVFAAEHATAELVGFTVRWTSGVLCVPLAAELCDRLALPPMCPVNEDRKGTAYTVSVDAREGVSTGISAAERARTIRALADPATVAADLTRPGHVFPLRARDGGVLARRGHTEAAVDLARMAGLRPVGAIAELVHDDGSVQRRPALAEFAERHGLVLLSVADLVAWRTAEQSATADLAARRAAEQSAAPAAEAQIPTRHGSFRAVGHRGPDGCEHLALVAGDLADGEDVLVRVHSECLTGDVVGSLRCDCGPQFDAALAAVAAEGRGVVLYLRGHEGRGVGLVAKLRAYALQEQGADTLDANLALGLPADARDYGAAARFLADLGVRSVRLLTNNPHKRAGLEEHGLRVLGRVPLPAEATAENVRYLRTKRDRMGHDLPALPEPERPEPVLAEVTLPEAAAS